MVVSQLPRPFFIATIAVTLTATPPHAAEFKINPPSLEEGTVSIEDNSAVTVTKLRPNDTRQVHFAEFGYGVTDYWWTEVEGHWESGLDGFQFRTVDVENSFRLVRQGNWLPETALFLEYDRAADARTSDTATVAGLFRKDEGPSSTVVNLFLDHDLGRNARTGLRLRYIGTSTWEVAPVFAPGVEFFGAPGKVLHFDSAAAQDHRVGPAVLGHIELAEGHELEYSAGYLFGLTRAAAAGTAVWRFEYDVRF